MQGVVDSVFRFSLGSSFMAFSLLCVVVFMAEWLLRVCEALCGIGFVWIVLLLSENSVVFLQLLSHIMLDALGLSARIVIAISFQKVYNAPNAETGANGGYKSL